jgi:hypothetical protein
MRLGKYAFNSKQQAEDKIKALGVELNEDGIEYPSHNHAIVKIGFLALENGEYNEEGEEIKPSVLSNRYSVDAGWKDLTEHPYGWAKYSVDVDGEGAHSFAGVNYQENKI